MGDTEIRLGKQVRKAKVLSTKEKKDQRMILGDHYQDKEFLRSIFDKLENKEIQSVMEEGFLFLTERSEFWRTQRPMYVIEGDRPSKNQLKIRRASRRMSIFTADLRKLKLKEDRDEGVEDEDTFDDTIDVIETGGPRPPRERKISIIDPK